MNATDNSVRVPRQPVSDEDREKRSALAEAIASRIERAQALANISTQDKLQRATGLQDRTLRRALAGGGVPRLETLMAIARTCKVSIDWLVFGAERVPESFHEWEKTPLGQGAPEAAKVWLSTLPTHGWDPPLAFYNHAFFAWEAGLSTELSAEEAARGAREKLDRSE